MRAKATTEEEEKLGSDIVDLININLKSVAFSSPQLLGILEIVKIQILDAVRNTE